MTEILTESFCERCGTRYTFETVQPKGRGLGALGTLGRGLRNFVVMSDSSLDEAMAAARSETDQRVTTAQLEAFHRTFNFCLSCRQYTCTECWNGVEGRCLSCAPLPEAEIVPPVAVAPPTTIDLPPLVEAVPVIEVAPPVEEQALPPEPEPTEPVGAEPAVEPAEAPSTPLEVPLEVEPPPMAPEATEAAAADAPEPEDDIVPVAPAPPEPAVAVAGEPEGAVALPEFLPGRSLDDEIAAYELRVAALAATPPEPLPPIIVAATPPPPIPTRAQRAPQPRAAAAVPAPSSPVSLTAAAPGTCRSCGLSISASARFCRRCGTSQIA